MTTREEVAAILAKSKYNMGANHRAMAESALLIAEGEGHRLDRIHEIQDLLEFVWANGWKSRDLMNPPEESR